MNYILCFTVQKAEKLVTYPAFFHDEVYVPTIADYTTTLFLFSIIYDQTNFLSKYF